MPLCFGFLTTHSCSHSDRSYRSKFPCSKQRSGLSSHLEPADEIELPFDYARCKGDFARTIPLSGHFNHGQRETCLSFIVQPRCSRHAEKLGVVILRDGCQSRVTFGELGPRAKLTPRGGRHCQLRQISFAGQPTICLTLGAVLHRLLSLTEGKEHNYEQTD